MKLNHIFLLSIFLIFSCKESSSESTTRKESSNEVAITQSKKSEIDSVKIKNISFDEKVFIKLINQEFQDVTEQFDLSDSLLEKSILKNNNVLKYIKSKAVDIKFHSFESEKSKIELFVINDLGQNMDSIYQKIKKLGYAKDRANDPIPGLSYANDFIYKTDNTIYWLNSPCTISYKNHLKIAEILEKLIESESDNKFYCKCGKVICE